MAKEKRTDLQIRGIPASLVSRIRARAQRSGQSMSQFLTELIQKDLDDRERMERWLEEVRNWEPISVAPGTDVAKAVREAREERAEHLANVARGSRERPRA